MKLDIEELDEKYSIEGELGFDEPEDNMIFISVTNKHAEADISLYGAHATRFKTHKTIDILWMSPDSFFEVGKPIRGGIPVCFPWFGPHKSDPSMPMHGFARLMFWDVAKTASLPGGETLVQLVLHSSDETKKFWPHDFYAEMIFIIGKTLSVTLKVTNTSNEPFEYTCALHSYYNISSIDEIRISGLQNTSYFNQLDGENYTQEAGLLEIKTAETRHYQDTDADCVIYDLAFGRGIHVSKSGSKVTTVWNPGEETCAKIDDLPDDGFHSFVCVEAVNAFNHVIHTAPGESHETSAIIGILER
jgi:glucose-6-phosphate 1-epimerase